MIKFTKIIAVLFVLVLAVSCGQADPVEESGAPQEAQTVADGNEPQQVDFDTMGFTQAPFFDGWDLPPVHERLPLVPKLTNELPAEHLDFQIGQFGGTLRTVTQGATWDADVFVAMNEPLLNSPGVRGNEVTGNILYGFEASDNQMEFTFFLREGLRWSDGVLVTMEDIRFTVESLIFNEDYTANIPNWLRSGGHAAGTPFRFEIIDDLTFRMIFDEPYGGFPIRLSISGWVGYTSLMLPSHFLKPFHIDYATPEEQALWPDLVAEHSITEMGELTWINILNHFRVNNWDVNQARAIGFPMLTPWLLVEVTDTSRIFERNPFYFKVDPAGNQLPYIDRIVSTTVQDMEMVQLMAISGEVDFMRESAALINMPLYRANEETGGFVTLMAEMHVTPTDIGINQTWAGGTDGYREMVQDVRFRRGLSYAIDRELIIDAIYFGFAEPNPWQDPTFDQDAAIALFEDMGMVRGDDGFFLQPDGDDFQIIIEHGNEAPDIGPFSELVAEMWRDVGINTVSRQIDGTLVGVRQAANEMQARVIWTSAPQWTFMSWGKYMWGRAWQMWRYNITEITYTDDDGNQVTRPMTGEVPPEGVQEFYNLVDDLMRMSVAEASTTGLDAVRQHLNDNLWYILPLYNVRQPLLVNNRLRNVTDQGFAIGVNFSLEQIWFEQD